MDLFIECLELTVYLETRVDASYILYPNRADLSSSSPLPYLNITLQFTD
jgi:hypothetical protein